MQPALEIFDFGDDDLVRLLNTLFRTSLRLLFHGSYTVSCGLCGYQCRTSGIIGLFQLLFQWLFVEAVFVTFAR